MLITLKKTKRKALLFWMIPLQFKLLFFINFILCGLARSFILLFPLPRLSPHFGRFHKSMMMCTVLSEKQRFRAQQIGRSVRLAAKYTPWDSSCLTQAMVAAFWCKRFKIPYMFYIGLTKSEDELSGFLAHAWITAGAVAVTGGHSLNYKVISSYSSIAHRY
jgi:hypothetical protein